MINFCILDAAVLGSELIESQKVIESFECLYSEKEKQHLGAVGPWLFQQKPGSNEEKWASSIQSIPNSGIFLFSEKSFNEVLVHFRKLTKISTEYEEQLYFRFYDPRVLRIFLPTCSKEQLKEFFGPVEAFYAENEDPSEILKFELVDGSLKTTRLSDEDVFQPTDEQLFSLSEEGDDASSETAKEQTTPEKNPPPSEEKSNSKKWTFF